MVRDINGLTRIRDKEKVIATLTSAFINYPKLTKAFSNQERRAIAMEANLRFYVPYSMKYGGAYALDDKCQGVAVILPSSLRKASKLRYIIAGSYSRRYKKAILKLTEDEKQIREEVFKEIDEMEIEIKFPPKYLFVSFLGVKSEHQRQGSGRLIMGKVIDYGKKKGLPVVLFTSEPKQVEFYKSMGFKIIGITSSKKFQFINIYLVKL